MNILMLMWKCQGSLAGNGCVYEKVHLINNIKLNNMSEVDFRETKDSSLHLIDMLIERKVGL